MVKKVYMARAIIRFNNKYLLLKKAKDSVMLENIGKWETPGGIMDKTGPDKTILREVEEETGLRCTIIKELPFLCMKDDKIDSQASMFLLEAPSDQVRLSDEHSDFIWIKASEVKNLKLVVYASLLLEYFNNEDRYLK